MSDNPLYLGAVVPNTSPALFPGPEPLVGKHVTLERLTQSHVPDLWESIGSNDKLWTWIPVGPFSTTSDFVDALNFDREGTEDWVGYSVIPRQGPSQGKAVGYMILLGMRLTDRAVEIGIILAPELQKTTAATEVLSLLCELVFEKLNFRRFEWKCNSLNVASKKAAERYGFVYEGTFRQHLIVKGRNRDSAWYSMIDSDWPLCRRVFEEWLGDGNFDERGRPRSRMEEIRERLK